jgi:hypothetical protein
LATAGGAVTLQALPGVLQPLAQIEPLRQILDGTGRSSTSTPSRRKADAGGHGRRLGLVF